MRSKVALIIVGLAVVFLFNGKKYDDAVTERLSTAVAVCLEGQSCGVSSMMMVASGSADLRSAEQVYAVGCAACHDAGVAGAPMKGNAAQWEPRIAKGIETLVTNAWQGIGGMPAKGLCSDCTMEEIEAAVNYMIESS